MALVALCIGVLLEVDREGRLNRDVLAQLERNDRAEDVRGALGELAHAARLAAATGTPEAAATVERLAGRVEAGMGEAAAASPALQDTVRLALLNARSVVPARQARGAAAADEPAREAERLAQRAAQMLDHEVTTHAARINRSTAAQLRMGTALRAAVAVAVVGALAMLAVVYAMYRAARRRERAALARIERLAHFDPLTGLPNRSTVTDRLELELARARRNAAPFAVLLFDLDGFKQVNDTWGHAAGDEALVVAARRARESLRASDSLGRLGGDEFLAVLPETDLAGARAVAEKLREALGRPYGLKTGEARMSASIGLALHPHDGKDAATLQRSADAALYTAKRAGRDRVEVAAEAAGAPAAG